MYSHASFAFLTLLTLVSASCNVCRTNEVVGNVNAMVQIHGQDGLFLSSSCGDLELAGAMARIPDWICLDLPLRVGICRCQKKSAFSSTTNRRRRRERKLGGQYHFRSLLTDDDSEWNFPTMAPSPISPSSPIMAEMLDETGTMNDDDMIHPNRASDSTGDDQPNGDEVLLESEYTAELNYDSEPLHPDDDDIDDDETQDNEYSDMEFEMEMLELVEKHKDTMPVSAPIVSPAAHPAVDAAPGL